MPQFELDAVGPARFSGLVRGRTPEDAVRTVGGMGEGAAVEVGSQESPQGWHAVRVDGAPAGRVRPHQRMRFRRD